MTPRNSNTVVEPANVSKASVSADNLQGFLDRLDSDPRLEGSLENLQEAINLAELSRRRMDEFRDHTGSILTPHGLSLEDIRSGAPLGEYVATLQKLSSMANTNTDLSVLFSCLGEFASAEELEKAYVSSVGSLRSIEFQVMTLRKSITDLEKKESNRIAQEKSVESRMQFLWDAKTQLDVRISEFEGSVTELEHERSIRCSLGAQVQSSEEVFNESKSRLEQVEEQLHVLKSSKHSLDVTGPSVSSARSGVQQLLSVLEYYEQKQAEVCEKKFSVFQSIIESEENRLRYLTLQRELKVLQGQDTMDLGVDFESTDIDKQKKKLQEMHKSVQSSEEKRAKLAGRIAELYGELEWLKWLR